VLCNEPKLLRDSSGWPTREVLWGLERRARVPPEKGIERRDSMFRLGRGEVGALGIGMLDDLAGRLIIMPADLEPQRLGGL
jgi:hypothetical protein